MSRAQRRYIRTIALGVAAMAALVWAAVDQFGIPWEEIWSLFLTTVLVMGGIIACAAVAVGVLTGLKRLGNRRD